MTGGRQYFLLRAEFGWVETSQLSLWIPILWKIQSFCSSLICLVCDIDGMSLWVVDFVFLMLKVCKSDWRAPVLPAQGGVQLSWNQSICILNTYIMEDTILLFEFDMCSFRHRRDVPLGCWLRISSVESFQRWLAGASNSCSGRSSAELKPVSLYFEYLDYGRYNTFVWVRYV